MRKKGEQQKGDGFGSKTRDRVNTKCLKKIQVAVFWELALYEIIPELLKGYF